MISINRDGTKVVINVSLPELGNGVFPFAFDCGREWVAKALLKILHEEFWNRVKEIRQDEYEHGLKDARKRKNERSTWFMSNFNRRG